MRRRNARNLVLHRDAIKRLTVQELSGVHGGRWPTMSVLAPCTNVCSTETSCETGCATHCLTLCFPE
jgi:hypothetical protein